MILAAAMILAAQGHSDAGFARARADNLAYCRSIHAGSDCAARQNREMGHFVTMMAGFDFRKGEPKVCMQRGKRGRYVDWTVATSCLRAYVKGRALGK